LCLYASFSSLLVLWETHQKNTWTDLIRGGVGNNVPVQQRFISNSNHIFMTTYLIGCCASKYQNTIQQQLLFSWFTFKFFDRLFIKANPQLEVLNKMKSIVQLKRMAGSVLEPVSKIFFEKICKFFFFF
jgi:hypothetical protein